MLLLKLLFFSKWKKEILFMSIDSRKKIHFSGESLTNFHNEQSFSYSVMSINSTNKEHWF